MCQMLSHLGLDARPAYGPRAAMLAIQKFAPDIVFLDINMPDLSGLEMLKTLVNPPSVIITTAYRQYAIEGFELNVVDYLLKPISFDRFLKAVNKFYMLHNSQAGTEGENGKRHADDFIFIQDGKTVYKTFVNEILYLEGYELSYEQLNGQVKMFAKPDLFCSE